MIQTEIPKTDLSIQNIERLLNLLITLIQEKNNKRVSSELLTQKELLKQLNISPNTLRAWENIGLKRLEPPIEGTRSVFYLLDDVLKFLAH
ncbi:helix-turn-helix transcriptional regulator [Lactococcus lactis]|uniref:MerR family transcriptional regulator n=1 Tax=Lactococcus lactis TaxID=1358 RepID=A0AAP3YZR5_9LACT|nr:MerR family transcriptional regulator [Lactococcus lactis]MDG4968908.1 MerR family transcriptional regulator [Lactococcus lactis]MDG4975715.1 MerR family transcriptional regulator [Lactococcus lactis]MDG5103003.1 MerR family transcriptional regulator [Lactococcus lactis]